MGPEKLSKSCPNEEIYTHIVIPFQPSDLKISSPLDIHFSAFYEAPTTEI
jgi:hypothetical protein